MHILLIHQYYQEKDDPGGLRWNEMTRLWSEAGHKITVIAGMTHYTKGIRHPKYHRKYFGEEQYNENIRVIRTHVSNTYNTNFRGRFRAYFSFTFSSIWGGLFKARDTYDILLVSSPPLSVAITARVLAFRKRIPFLFEVRDLWPESAIDTGVLKNKWMIRWSYRLERKTYAKAKAINVLTPAFFETLVTQKKVPPQKLIYVPNAADIELTDQVDAKLNREQFRTEHQFGDALVLCYVGAHGIANALDQILHTAGLLRTENVLFLLIGDGMQKNALQEKAKEMSLDNVRFIDSVPKEKVLEYILASDIGLSVLKKVDTFKTVYSNKTFDYMACRKPIIMAIDGASRKLVEDAGAGTYCEPEDPEMMADIVRSYLKDIEKIRREGAQGRAYVEKHFDRKKLAEKYLRAIEQIIT